MCLRKWGKLNSGEKWSPILQDHKIDFVALLILQKTEFHSVSFRVFHPMAIFQQMRRNQILETWPLILSGRPVAKVELLLLLVCLDLWRTVRRDGVALVDGTENIDPVRDRVGGLGQILSNGIE